MNRFFAILVLLFVLPIPSIAQYNNSLTYSSLYDGETITSLKEHIINLSSVDLEGRKAGSEGETRAAKYLESKFKEYGIDLLSHTGGDLFGISHDGADTLVSRNIIGYVQGNDKAMNDKYIVIGARLDNLGTMTMNIDGEPVQNVFCGANGNASGLAMLLELGKRIKTNSIFLRRSILLIGFGASEHTYAGAWYFLNRTFTDSSKIDAMINLDMLGTGANGFYAYTASNEDLNSLIRKLEGELQPIKPQIIAYETYPSDHRAFYAKEIPAVHFTTGKYLEHNTVKDTESIINYEMMERELEYIYNFTMLLSDTSLDIRFHTDKLPPRGPSYDDVIPYHECDQPPMFLNSSNPKQFMEKWVYQYLKYPPNAVRDGIQGRVIVDFIIDKSGKVTDVRVVRGVSPELDEEAVRVVSASPKWRPARLNRAKVRCSMSVAVDFRLEKKSKRSFGFKKHTY